MNPANQSQDTKSVNRISVIFYCVKETSNDAIPYLEIFEKFNNLIEIHHANNLNEVIEFTKINGHGIVFFEIYSKDDVVKISQLLTKLAPELSNLVFRAIGFCNIPLPKIESYLLKNGVSELLQKKLSNRTIHYKTEQWIKAAKISYKKIKANEDRDLKRKSRGMFMGESNSTSSPRNTKACIHWSEPLPLKADFWILLSKKNISKSNYGFAVELLGPPPNVATWKEKSPGIWKYVVLKQTDYQLFDPEFGEWIFTGNKPEYSWETYTWHFSSKTMNLSFIDSNNNSYRKLGIEGNDLIICKNKSDAQKHVDLILKLLTLEISSKKYEVKKTSFNNLVLENIDTSKSIEFNIETSQVSNSNSNNNDYVMENDEPLVNWDKGSLSMTSEPTGPTHRFDHEQNSAHLNVQQTSQPSSSGTSFNLPQGDSSPLGKLIKNTFQTPAQNTGALNQNTDWTEKLKTIGLKIEIENPDTKQKSDLIFLDLFDNLLVAQPTDAIDINRENLNIRIQFSNSGSPVDFVASIKLLSSEKTEGPHKILTLDISNVDSKFIELFMSIIQNRQVDANHFVELARGL